MACVSLVGKLREVPAKQFSIFPSEQPFGLTFKTSLLFSNGDSFTPFAESALLWHVRVYFVGTGVDIVILFG